MQVNQYICVRWWWGGHSSNPSRTGCCCKFFVLVLWFAMQIAELRREISTRVTPSTARSFWPFHFIQCYNVTFTVKSALYNNLESVTAFCQELPCSFPRIAMEEPVLTGRSDSDYMVRISNCIELQHLVDRSALFSCIAQILLPSWLFTACLTENTPCEKESWGSNR